MRIYLDDDSASPVLATLLTKEGHDVVIPIQTGTVGSKDAAHFMYAIREQRVLLTHNHEDFQLLHDLVLLVKGHHPGLLIIRKDNDPSRDMTAKGIVRALRRLLGAQPSLEDQVQGTNRWPLPAPRNSDRSLYANSKL